MKLNIEDKIVPTESNPGWPTHWEFTIKEITPDGVSVRDHNNNLDFISNDELKEEHWTIKKESFIKRILK